MPTERDFAYLQIRHVTRIWELPDRPIESDDDIMSLIELPLRGAVGVLLAKGIHPFWSTANARDQWAMIFIEPENLSPANIEIARRITGYMGNENERVSLEYPITPDTFVAEVDQHMVGLAEQFVDQNGTG